MKKIKKKCRKIACLSALLVSANAAPAQTYQVSGRDSQVQQTQKTAPNTSAEQDLGWGSNIQNARLARTAELAIQRGDHALALSYAKRAAEAAPNDAQLWFLYGYAARLDGKLLAAVDAYQHGLKLNRSSSDGMSGLAQTYIASGLYTEAERLLRAVVAASPQRRNDLLILADLNVRAGNYEGALQWINNAERIEPNAQSELLMAVAYQHLTQMEQAGHYLALARTHAPNNPDVQRAFAAYYRETGDYPKAVDALAGIRNPKPDVLAELAFTYALAGRPEDSARTYAVAANQLPRDLSLQLSAAQAQVSIAAFDRAETFLQRATKLNPNYYRLHAIRGEIAQMHDNNEVAANEISAAIANLPSAPLEGPLYGIQLHADLVPLYRSLNEPAQADEEVDESKQLIAQIDEQGSNRAAFLRLRALIHSNANELDKALADMNESLALSPNDPNSLQLQGDVLFKLGRIQDAIKVFESVLKIDTHSRFALTSLAYAYRANGDAAKAEHFFLELARQYPTSFVPYLALGDMYTERQQYRRAEEAYRKGYTLAPRNAMIVAGGMNAAIEARDFSLAGGWQKRVTEEMATVPQVLREEERYFSFTGDAQRSAELGRQALKLAPQDREVVIYLGYDLLHLEQFDELNTLTQQYMDTLPKEADIPLLAAYVEKHNERLEEAINLFTEALRRDPNVVTAYNNRGFVYNDLGEPELAAKDFEEALRRKPNDTEAHMGLAFAELNLNHPKAAIHQTELAEAIAGDSKLLHTVRAMAYGRLGMQTKSAAEYKAAIVLDPKDGTLYLGLGNIYIAQRRFHEALAQFQSAEQRLPTDPFVYASIARVNAELHDREATLRAVDMADRYVTLVGTSDKKYGKDSDKASAVADVYMATGEAMSVLGDEHAAIDRFSKALAQRPKDRVAVRLAIARHMATQELTEAVERQIALAQLEVDAKDANPITGDQYISIANLLQQVHEYELSEGYLERAKDAGASDTAVRVSLANSYLALGETRLAASQLAAVKSTEDSEIDYQYLLAQAALYQQEHRSLETLSSFAAATSDAQEDPVADQGLIAAGGEEGYRLNSKVSMISNLTVQPIFEDSTVYVLDAKLNSPAGPVSETDTANLPTPRSSVETNLINSLNFHVGSLPAPSAFVQIRNAQGAISVPATQSVVHRNTTDYALNLALNPTVRLGSNAITFNSGAQGTIRRDTRSPIEMDQNLVRVFTYATTSSFFNAVSADGFASAEFGKFTNMPITERLFSGAVNFRVGNPWGKNSLLTGWSVNKQNFKAVPRGPSENFVTTSYIGFQRKFSTNFSAAAIMEDLRSWRSQPFSPIGSAISQAIRPGLSVRYAPNTHLELQASSSFESTRGFHVYDMTQNSFTVFYTRALSRTFSENSDKVHVKYPIRIAAGLREETFPNFSGASSTRVVPFFNLTIF